MLSAPCRLNNRAVSLLRRFLFSTQQKDSTNDNAPIFSSEMHATNNESDLNINRLTDNPQQNWENNTLKRKLNRGTKDIIRPRHCPQDANKNIQELIDVANNTKEIVSVIQQNLNIIKHPAIFGKAMKKCNNFKDHGSVRKIMDLLMSEAQVEPTIVQFTSFINSMARFDKPELSKKYFDAMIKDYKIQPDVAVFSALIKSFKKQGRSRDAEKYWRMMIDTYMIKPDEAIYSEILAVYAVANSSKESSDLFDEYLQMIDVRIITANKATFSAYLNIFSKCGDIKGMTSVTEKLNEYGLESDHIWMTDVMRGYYNARDYDGALNVYKQCVEDGMVIGMAMLHLKCAALAFTLRNESASFDDKCAVYDEIKHTIYHEVAQYGLKADPKIYRIQLSGAIFLYRYVDPRQIVKVFEEMVDNECIGYQTHETQFGEPAIDLYSFQRREAQFILRYLFGFECERLMGMLVDDKLWIVAGKGLHAGAPNRKDRLREFIMSELMSWDPAIKAYDSNPRMLYINKNDILPYLEDNNFAKQRLTEPSNDWFNEVEEV